MIEGATAPFLSAQQRWIKLHHPERLGQAIEGVKFVHGTQENRIAA